MDVRKSRDKTPVASASKSATAGDKRRTPRLDIERTVQAVIDGTQQVACTLSDVSKSGARLTLDAPSSLPDTFELIFRDDLRKWCQVVRRSETFVGIKFVVAPAAAEAAPSTASPPLTPADSPETSAPATTAAS